MRSNELRYCCQKLEIGSSNNTEKVWVKQLRKILDTDIHKKELGCKCDTHIKIGAVHLNTFYESRILFSHNVWSNRFATWLFENLEKTQKKRFIVVGYETDVEPIIFQLQNKITDNERILRYGIYEERKFTQNNGYAQTEENIRYLDGILDLLGKSYDPTEYQIVFFCGTSTTLSTFKKMREQLINDFKKKDIYGDVLSDIISNSLFFSLIQILPFMGQIKEGIPFQSIYNEADLIDTAHNRITRRFSEKEDDKIVSEYLVDIQNQWYDAEHCPLCFPLEREDKDIFKEEPLISTSETSFVPFMMIRELRNNTEKLPEKTSKINTNELLWNDLYGYNYVYYDHIDRMDHHFKYYVRTAHLIKDIMDNKYPNERRIFIKRCEEISDEINKEQLDKRVIDIIVYPSSFGDEVFPLAINKHVFGDKAYLLAVNPNKEFRSNFETKYSNLAYVLEQTASKTEIKFHYVAKQIHSIDTFSRIKSFIRSMMCKHTEDGLLPSNVKLFSSVIVFLSRISNSSISDYIEIENFYHFIDVAIPSLRNYGDSCPICKRRQDVSTYIKASNLDICISHWSQKHDLYKPKSIENAIERWENESKSLREQKYRRFYCENKIWNRIKILNCNDESSYLQAYIEGMCNDKKYVEAEDFISCIKAISGPFLYFKEYAKNAALHLLLHSIESIRKMKPVGSNMGAAVIVEVTESKRFSIQFQNIFQQYTTLVVLINCLASMDSTYILNPRIIVDLCKFVDSLSKHENIKILRDTEPVDSLLTFGKGNCLTLIENDVTRKVEAFLSCIVYAFKRVICGISGEAKSKYFSNFFNVKYSDVIFNESGLDSRISDLFFVLFIENSSSCSCYDEQKRPENIIEKYRKFLLVYLQGKIANQSKEDCIKLLFAYKDPSFNHIYPLSGFDDDGKTEHSKSKYEVEFNLYYKKKYYECFNSKMLEYCGWSKNESDSIYVISLKSYSEGMFSTKVPTDYSKEKTMYLVVEFLTNIPRDETSEQKFTRILGNLETIRMLLEDRYSLCEEIKNDIQNNSIREAIQAREAELLMAEGKNVAHNGSRDVRDMLNLIKDELISLSKSKENNQRNASYSNACKLISVMMSYCIGRASNDYLLRSYYKWNSNKSVFKNGVLHFDYSTYKFSAGLGIQTKVDEIVFLESYFSDLLRLNDDNSSDYLKECLYKRCNNDNDDNDDKNVMEKLIGEISILINGVSVKEYDNPTKEIIKIVKDYNSFPDIFKNNNYTTNTSAGSIFLVGFLDLFIRNVVKHASGSNVEINIDSKSESHYTITVENDISVKSDYSSPGITNWFFESLTQMATNSRKGFRVICTPNNEGTKYISRIKIYRSGGKNI